MVIDGITVFSKPACVQCDATCRRLDEKRIPYKIIDLTEDAEALAYVTDVLGYRQAPVIVVKGDHWSGFRPDKLSSLRTT